MLHVECGFALQCALYSTFRSVTELLLSPHGDDICLQGVWPLRWPLGRSRRLRPLGALLLGVPGDFSSWKGFCDPTTHFQWDKPPMGSPKVSQGVTSASSHTPGSSLAHSPGSPAFPIGVGLGSLPGDPVSRVPQPSCQPPIRCVGVTVTRVNWISPKCLPPICPGPNFTHSLLIPHRDVGATEVIEGPGAMTEPGFKSRPRIHGHMGNRS